jgi:hypothetical protein
MEKITYQILKTSNTGVTMNIPLHLTSTVDEMGVMVGFDGNIEQVEKYCNFSYTQTGNTIQVYNTVFIENFKTYSDAIFTVEWGDGTTSNLPPHNGNLLTTTTKTYTNGEYVITIKLETPWTRQKLSKIVTIPKDISKPNPLGTFSGFTIPYTILQGSQDYLNDLDYTNYTGQSTFKFVSIGKSRISEKKKYGSSEYVGVTTGITVDGLTFSKYQIDSLDYMDFTNGYTMITGTTVGYTKEDVFNKMLTRDEHFIGFIDEPTIYTDVFVERGKLGVLENNLRLGEIDSTGEMEIYGNGFFSVKKQ